MYLSLIHISEPTRLGMISYAVFCLKKNTKKKWWVVSWSRSPVGRKYYHQKKVQYAYRRTRRRLRKIRYCP